ncbi:Twinfilin-1 [Coemansia sp. RSA 1939]|nr:Twinfilin-1 [Coemansia sp. RSA 1939]KAJ2601240.1 Twinfilin-1 [Coemansia sp. RSA 1804]
MAHQSGIQGSSDLSAKFVDALSAGTTRALKVSIVGETLEATGNLQTLGTLEEDMDRLHSLLEETEPCYLLVRLDGGNGSTGDGTQQPAGNKWMFCSYVPDSAKVRAKMLYASTKATVTKTLGESYFIDDIFGTDAQDFSASGYRRHRQHVDSGAPLTEREEEMQRIRDLEGYSAADMPTMDSRRTHVSGATCPLTDGARTALSDYARGTVNIVVLAIDPRSETVDVDRAETLQSHDDVAPALPANAPRFVFYWYDSSTSLFVYSCPASCGMRERMVYSSFRHGLLTTAQDSLGVAVHAKFEVDDPKTELSAQALAQEVADRIPAARAAASSIGGAQAAPAAQPRFKRPLPPGRRPRTSTPPASSSGSS